MSQTAGFRVTNVPQDITAGLDPGTYIAQATSGETVFYLTAENAPVRVAATFARRWFQAKRGETFCFRVGTGITPTWATSSQSTISLAVADLAIARVSA